MKTLFKILFMVFLVGIVFCPFAESQQYRPGQATMILNLPALPAACIPQNGRIVYLTTGNTGIYSCIARNVWARIDTSEVFNVKAFGATGDGVTNDTVAINTTFAAQSALGKGTVYFPAGRYHVSPGGVVPRITSDTTILAYGATLFCNYTEYAGGDTTVFYPWTTYTLPDADINVDTIEGSVVLTVPTTANLLRGYGIVIYTTNDFYSTTYLKSFMTVVTEVININTFRIKDPLPYTFLGAANNILIHIFPVIPKISIQGLTVEWVGTPGGAPANEIDGIIMEYFFYPTVKDVTVKNCSGYNFKTTWVYGGSFDSITVQGPPNIIGYGYGVGTFSNFNSTYTNVESWASRHAVAVSGTPSWDLVFANCDLRSQVYDSGVSWNSHIHGRVYIRGCTMMNGMKYGGGYLYISDSTIANKVTGPVFENRGTIDFQCVFEVRSSRIYLYLDAPTQKYVWVPTAPLLYYGSIRFIDNIITNVDAGAIPFFGGGWYVTEMNEVRIDGNKYISPAATGLTFWTFAFQFETPGNPGDFWFTHNDFPFCTMGLPDITDPGSAFPYDVSHSDFPLVFASLSALWANGSIVYCSDCTLAAPCAAGGTGAIAKRLNGVWVCN
jgi:hypothetical protein